MKESDVCICPKIRLMFDIPVTQSRGLLSCYPVNIY